MIFTSIYLKPFRLDGNKLEDSLSVAPSHEASLFRNRDRFDLVVMYDDASESLGSAGSPLSTVMKVIFETAINKPLKRPPVILVGGLKAWREQFPHMTASSVPFNPSTSMNKLTDLTNTMSLHDSSRSERRYGLPSSPKANLQKLNGITYSKSADSAHEIWTPNSKARVVNGSISSLNGVNGSSYQALDGLVSPEVGYDHSR